MSNENMCILKAVINHASIEDTTGHVNRLSIILNALHMRYEIVLIGVVDKCEKGIIGVFENICFYLIESSVSTDKLTVRFEAEVMQLHIESRAHSMLLEAVHSKASRKSDLWSSSKH